MASVDTAGDTLVQNISDYPRTGTGRGDTVMMLPTGNVENTCCAVHSLVDISRGDRGG
jgi:hypothetical protein